MLYLGIDDTIGADRVLGQYRLQDIAMENSREIRLATEMLKLYSEKDAEGMEKTVYNYRKVTPFNEVNQKLYQRIKDNLEKVVQNNYFDGTGLT